MRDVPYETLVAYAAGELVGDEARDVEARLATSPELEREVRLARSAIETMRSDDSTLAPEHLIERAAALLASRRQQIEAPKAGLAASLLERAHCVVATLLFDSREQPMLSGFRSGSALTGSRHFMYGSPLGEIDLQVQAQQADKPARLLGQIDLPEQVEANVAVIDRGREQVIARCTSDNRGFFQFDAPAGQYDLRIDAGERSVLLEDVQIG